MSETTQESTGAGTWQPEPAAIHPSLDRYQRLSAFTLDPTPPPGGARMVKGMAYHAVCGTPMTSKVLDNPAFGEYGCQTCEERGYLVKVPAADLPDPQHQARPTGVPIGPAPDTTRALVTVEAAERLVVRAYQPLAALSDDDLRMAPLSVAAAVQQARAILAETANVTTTTTVSMVKDQDWSDEISRGASESVTKTMTLVERALAPR